VRGIEVTEACLAAASSNNDGRRVALTNDPETPQTQDCGCPEVRLTDDERAALTADNTCQVPEWIVYCWYREYFTEALGKVPLDSSSPEPVNWRCPKCKGSIIRTGVRPEEDEDQKLFPWLRLDFRCSSPSCDWDNYLLTLPSDGLMAGA
jgi:hypothetical protein